MAGGARGGGAGRVKPISQYVLKVHSRCDLACDHCYIYEHPDQSWRHRPLGIDPAVARTAATRIAEHAAAHRLPEVRVVLHGGEPLLLGETRLRDVLAELQSRVGAVTRLDVRLQTNAVRLSPALCALFAEYGVKVGVSLDGDRAANDRHRRFADGRSSHTQVRRGLELLRSPSYRDIFAGILCTVDIANDPIRVFDALLGEEPPRIDFLLPHGNWDHPPPRPEGAETAYADWLTRIFDRWVALGRPIPIRLFDSLEALAVGQTSQSEGIGAVPVDLLVIETDGSWEQVDSLKSAYDGAAATGMNVFEHAVDLAAAHPAIASRQEGISALCETCQACPVVERCGGGLYSHRYRSGTDFRNPSVYCADLKRLIEHVGIPEPASSVQSTHGRAQQTATATSEVTGLSAEDLDAIAACPVDRTLAQRLAASHLAITRIAFEEIWNSASRCTAGDDRLAVAGWELMRELDASAPDAVRTVLAHPFARPWAMRRIEHTGCGPSCVRELAHLASFAIAAAVHAGASAELVIPLRDGIAYLPTLGAVDLRRPNSLTAAVAVREGVLEVCDGGAGPNPRIKRAPSAIPDPREPILRGPSQIGTDHRITLEDLDPYRDCHGFQVTGRLGVDQVDRWHRTLCAATDTLKRWSPQYSAQAAACIRALVPLVADASGLDRSATSCHTFGAFGAALPTRPEALAMLLVHESQHTVLNPVLDAADLTTEDDRLYSVAWRPDPRPARAVLQGVFAFLALAEVWRTRGRTSATEGDAARDQSDAYAADAERALDALGKGAALTPLGERFAAGLHERLRRLRK